MHINICVHIIEMNVKMSAREYFRLSVRNCFFALKSFMIESNFSIGRNGESFFTRLKTGQTLQSTAWSSFVLAGM